jgi:hypothetical protein
MDSCNDLEGLLPWLAVCSEARQISGILCELCISQLCTHAPIIPMCTLTFLVYVETSKYADVELVIS